MEVLSCEGSSVATAVNWVAAVVWGLIPGPRELSHAAGLGQKPKQNKLVLWLHSTPERVPWVPSCLSGVPCVEPWYSQPNLFGSQVCLLSHTPAFLKRGNFLSHHENSKKPDNYCNDSNRWKSSVRYHLKSKSEYFLACFANAFCNRKIWLQQGNTILVRKHWDYSCFFFKGEKKSQRNITNTCKAVNIYSHHDWSIAVTLGWNRSL